jgi:hypothetical protein
MSHPVQTSKILKAFLQLRSAKKKNEFNEFMIFIKIQTGNSGLLSITLIQQAIVKRRWFILKEDIIPSRSTKQQRMV